MEGKAQSEMPPGLPAPHTQPLPSPPSPAGVGYGLHSPGGCSTSSSSLPLACPSTSGLRWQLSLHNRTPREPHSRTVFRMPTLCEAPCWSFYSRDFCHKLPCRRGRRHPCTEEELGAQQAGGGRHVPPARLLVGGQARTDRTVSHSLGAVCHVSRGPCEEKIHL